jgi:hypothetical protein
MRRMGGAALALLLVLTALVLTAGACGGGDGDERGAAGDGRAGGSDEAGATTARPGTGTDAASGDAASGTVATAGALCRGAVVAASPPVVASPELTEVSGLAASRRHPDVLWAHNDSGGGADVFAVGLDGSDRGRFELQGAEAVDWEDMALGPAPGGGADVLYLGDIGDNRARRDHVVVYRVAEPAPGPPGVPLAGVEALALDYPDGPRDAEALLADPRTGDLFVVDKVLLGPATAYRLPATATPGGRSTLERAGPVAVPPGEIVTGADISADGSVVAVRTYAAVFLWDRGPGQSVADALAGEPCRAPSAVEGQGESIALTADGRGWLTVSEGQHPPVNAVRLG